MFTCIDFLSFTIKILLKIHKYQNCWLSSEELNSQLYVPESYYLLQLRQLSLNMH